MTGLVPITWLKTGRTRNRSSSRCLSCAAPKGNISAHFEIFNSTTQVNLSFADSLRNICRGSLVPVRYVIAVSSLPTATHQRNIIRADLWYTRNASSSVKLIFFVGRPSNLSLLAHVEYERHLQADIVLGSYSGVPESASLATLVMLRWVAEFCTGAPFVIKITDEGRVNARFLQVAYDLNVKLADEFDMLGSFVSLRGEACGEPPVQHSARRCPDHGGFLSGCAYMLAQRIVRPLLRASEMHPPVLPEDVYVTGTLAEAIGAKRGEPANFEGCYYSYVKSMSFVPRTAYYWLRDRLLISLTRLSLYWQEI
ncbi:beta-1,3-galactosyltransferase 4-like [Rhipicephalus microplus]|uniref:beta-1,3-galactosyltransferase 4-like n=1 Tax=Rhipicephalus microplus TaxID=6941 RepID=UPI003F6CE7C6